jgi:hypothetical protein
MHRGHHVFRSRGSVDGASAKDYPRKLLDGCGGRAERVPTAFSPAGAAIVFVSALVAGRVLVDEVALLPLLGLYLPIHAAQLVANRVNEVRAPHAERNERLSAGNRIVVAIGGLLFLSAVWNTLEAIKLRLGAP